MTRSVQVSRLLLSSRSAWRSFTLANDSVPGDRRRRRGESHIFEAFSGASGDWDLVLEEMAVREHAIVEIHLERMQVSDVALAAISNCSSLEILHLVKTSECTQENCLRIPANGRQNNFTCTSLSNKI